MFDAGVLSTITNALGVQSSGDSRQQQDSRRDFTNERRAAEKENADKREKYESGKDAERGETRKDVPSDVCLYPRKLQYV
jgi:hypothetical protein